MSLGPVVRATSNRSLGPARFVLLALGGGALLAGLTGALVLLGVGMPRGTVALAASHGELMTLGFLGTVIALERAVALGDGWGYLAPALAAVGAGALVAGAPGLGAAAFLGAAIVLVAVYLAFFRVERSLQLAVQAAGSAAWVGAAALLAAGTPVESAYPWLAAFLVLTVVGERLDLARLVGASAWTRRQLVVALAVFVVGVAVTTADADLGVRIAGLAMLAIAAWLLRNDLARRTIRLGGVTRYIALCLIAGYVWLMVAGAAWVVTGAAFGAGYDIRLHAVFLGFVVSMVFGHAPVIVPAVLRVPLPFRGWNYAALGLLHTGLVIRLLGGDVLGLPNGLLIGGVLNVVALLAFVIGAIASAVVEIRRRRLVTARRAAASAT